MGNEDQGLPCPYCGVDIVPTPKRSRKCPSCKGKVVRKARGETVRLITVEQADAEDAEYAREASRQHFRTQVGYLGMGDVAFDRREKLMIEQYGVAKPGDVFWSLANEAVVEAGKRNDHPALSSIYQQMGVMLLREGRPFLRVMQEWSRAHLRAEAAASVVRTVSVSATNDSCPACRENNAREFTIKEALAQLPIPNSTCTGADGWCRCCWVAGDTGLEAPDLPSGPARAHVSTSTSRKRQPRTTDSRSRSGCLGGAAAFLGTVLGLGGTLLWLATTQP